MFNCSLLIGTVEFKISNPSCLFVKKKKKKTYWKLSAQVSEHAFFCLLLFLFCMGSVKSTFLFFYFFLKGDFHLSCLSHLCICHVLFAGG
jgi:hypothetical protein